MTDFGKKELMNFRLNVPVSGREYKFEWEGTPDQAVSLVALGFLALVGIAILKAILSES